MSSLFGGSQKKSHMITSSGSSSSSSSSSSGSSSSSSSGGGSSSSSSSSSNHAGKSPARTVHDQKGKGAGWLNAWYDPVAGVHAYSPCMELVDLQGDGDVKLVVATLDRKLKVFKGTSLVSEHALMEVPVAIKCYYLESKRGEALERPVIAVASGAHVFVYSNLRPYFKYSLPETPIAQEEQEVWDSLKDGSRTRADAVDLLQVAKDSNVVLSSRSMDLLGFTDEDEADEYVGLYKDMPLQQQTVVTCLGVVNKNVDGDKAVGQLVVGTESGMLLVTASNLSGVKASVKLPSTPVYVACAGKFEVDYRIVVACRDARVYSIKRGELMGNSVTLESQPNGLVYYNKQIFVSCMDNTIQCYTEKADKLWSVHLEHNITAFAPLYSYTREFHALLVATDDNRVRVYNERNVVSTFDVKDSVMGMRFGTYSREEHSLVLSLDNGGLDVRFLPRLTNIQSQGGRQGPPAEQDVPLNVPAKTQVYLEQAQREVAQGVDMHRVSQKELYKLRHSTARAYVKTISDTHGALYTTNAQSIKMNAEVQGMGPLFRLRIQVTNTGKRSITDLPLVLSYDKQLYEIQKPIMFLPALVPTLTYKKSFAVESIDVNGANGPIKVLLLNPTSCVPMITYIVHMPVSELLLE